jgi:hypothetical protein
MMAASHLGLQAAFAARSLRWRHEVSNSSARLANIGRMRIILCYLLALAQPPRQLVLRSATAIGGLDKLQAETAVRTVEEGLEFFTSVGDPRVAPSAIAETITTLRRMAPVGLRQTTVTRFAMANQPFTQSIVASDSVVSRGGVAAASAFDAATASEVLALAPDRILLTALAASDLTALHDSVIDGVPHHVVAFHWADARVRLAIDAATGFPDAVWLVRAYPTFVFWSLWGDITFATRWSGWTLEANGVWYPRQRLVTFNGEPWRRFLVTEIDVAPATPPDSFAIADSVRPRFAMMSHGAPTMPEPTLTPVTLADGVVLFAGYYQSALIRERDGIIVLDASQSNAKSRAVLAQAARLFPGIPITAVITTASAWMQIGGVREYVSRGIPIYALDVNTARVRAVIAAPYATHPDSLARAPRTASVRMVHAPVTLGSGANEIRLLPAASDLLVYWPARRWLYASDMIVPPAFEPNYNAARAETLRRTITALAIPVDSVFAFHLPLTAWH